MNRSLVGRIATLHFAPTANNAHNLEREAVEGDIFVTGNTVIDAMAYTVRGSSSSRTNCGRSIFRAGSSP